MVSHASLTRTATNCVCSERASQRCSQSAAVGRKTCPCDDFNIADRLSRRSDTLERTRGSAARLLQCFVSSPTASPTFRILNHYLQAMGSGILSRFLDKVSTSSHAGNVFHVQLKLLETILKSINFPKSTEKHLSRKESPR